jgi:hypothetical protein
MIQGQHYLLCFFLVAQAFGFFPLVALLVALRFEEFFMPRLVTSARIFVAHVYG